MASNRNRTEWKRTASLMALIANCHRNPKTCPEPFKPSDFEPREYEGEVEPMAGSNIEVLRIFVPGNAEG